MRPSPSRDPRPAPNLAQVEALIAIVDYGSFTAAAEVLRISQPSLSRRVRALEEALGTRLFLPVGRRRELTDTGRRIVAAGRRALGEMSSIEAMVASARELATGSLRVTGLPSLVSTVLTDLVGVFHREHPGVRIEISTVEDRDELLEAIRVGRADAAAGVIDRVPDDLAAMPLPSQEFAAVLPSAGPDSARHPDRSLTARDLSERTLVTLPPGASIRQLAESVYRSFAVEPARILTTTQRDSLVQLSVAVGGVTVVPDVLARTAPAVGGRRLPLHTPVQRAIGILHRQDRFQSPALRRFLDLARSHEGA
ncbi:transcriptional regulator, LysR-family [Brachybacterium faecium]|nr:transcriptional regulator, LysR-family [Brachybacterium faecium]